MVAAVLLLGCRGPTRAKAPPEVLTVGSHAESFVAWAERGVRDRVVVHIDAHDDFRAVAPAQLERLRDIVRARRFDVVGKRLDTGADELMNEGDYLYAAHRLGLIKQVYWVVSFGSRAAPEMLMADRLALREMGFSKEEVKSLRRDQGRLVGEARGVPLVVCGLADLPALSEPVLLDIDIDLFSILARKHSISIADSLVAFRRDLARSGIEYDVATVARSVSDGYTLVGHGYVAAVLDELLSSPTLELPPARWATVRRRSAAAAMHESGAFADALAARRELLQQEPDDAAAHYDVAESALALDDVDEAHEHAVFAANIDPLYEHGLIQFGQQLSARGREAALRFFDSAEGLAPGSPAVARARGDYYFDRELYRRALSEYAKIEHSKDKGLAMRMGDAYMLLEGYEDGLMYYDLASRLGEPDFGHPGQYAASWLLLGRYYEHVAGDVDKAREHYDRYLSTDGARAATGLAAVKEVSKLYD